jgi:hypothetical protein
VGTGNSIPSIPTSPPPQMRDGGHFFLPSSLALFHSNPQPRPKRERVRLSFQCSRHRHPLSPHHPYCRLKPSQTRAREAFVSVFSPPTPSLATPPSPSPKRAREGFRSVFSPSTPSLLPPRPHPRLKRERVRVSFLFFFFAADTLFRQRRHPTLTLERVAQNARVFSPPQSPSSL